MARLMTRDERGVVYVEFLLSFFPLFLLFLALCQLALVGAAEAIVRHSAYAAARSAIVILEDAPEKFDKAERGSLSQGRPSTVKTLDDVVSKLGIERVSVASTGSNGAVASIDHLVSQRGARMVPIRAAAYLPLLSIAPNEGIVREQTDSVGGALVASSNHQLGFAVQYTKAATVVTLHDAEDTQALAMDPVGSKSPVTARVTYLFHCTIPVVRAIMCQSPVSIATRGLLPAAVAFKTKGIVRPDARFKLLTATATLPNQGAGYLTTRAP